MTGAHRRPGWLEGPVSVTMFAVVAVTAIALGVALYVLGGGW